MCGIPLCLWPARAWLDPPDPDRLCWRIRQSEKSFGVGGVVPLLEPWGREFVSDPDSASSFCHNKFLMWSTFGKKLTVMSASGACRKRWVTARGGLWQEDFEFLLVWINFGVIKILWASLAARTVESKCVVFQVIRLFFSQISHHLPRYFDANISLNILSLCTTYH